MDSISNSGLTRVPYRFRAQWGGSDVDGEVVGFFVAVTETTVDVTTGRAFRLPPPKPQDYHFTTARESLFTFDVTEGRGTDREHALYVYSIDNQGKVDPTPAVTHFVARDQNLPGIRWLVSRGDGIVFLPPPGGGPVAPQPYTTTLRDPENNLRAPLDTIPSGGSVTFAWHGFDDDFNSSISGYRYKLTETDFVKTDSTVTSVDYGKPTSPTPGALPIGLNVFRLVALDEAQGSTQPDSTRQFIVNFSPDTWLAGPDPNAPELAGHLLRDSLGVYFPTDSTAGTWGRAFAFPGNPLTDTLSLRPSERPVTDGLSGRVKTIVEQRVTLTKQVHNYIRSEDDTVAFGSLIVARFGGTDKDSPYRVPGGSPDSAARVFQAGPPNGSPVGFQARLQYAFVNGGGVDIPFSTEFPNIDPFDALFNKSILFTVDQIDQTGRAFLQFRAVDGDRANDGRIGQARRAVERDELTPELRSKVFTFYTNLNPGLLIISPRPDTVETVGQPIQILVRVTDPDPDPALQSGGATGLETMTFVIRARVYARGAEVGPDEGWQAPVRGNFTPEPGPFFPYTVGIPLTVNAPSDLPVGPATLEIEVSDNQDSNKARVIHATVPIGWGSN